MFYVHRFIFFFSGEIWSDFDFWFSETGHQPNGDKWEAIDAVIQTRFCKDLHVFSATLARRFENLHTLPKLKLPSSITDPSKYQIYDAWKHSG